MQGQSFTSGLDPTPTESNLNLVTEMNSWEKKCMQFNVCEQPCYKHPVHPVSNVIV